MYFAQLHLDLFRIQRNTYFENKIYVATNFICKIIFILFICKYYYLEEKEKKEENILIKILDSRAVYLWGLTRRYLLRKICSEVEIYCIEENVGVKIIMTAAASAVRAVKI